MRSVGRIARLVVRSAAACALVYVVCLPLEHAILRVVTAAAGGVLRIVDRPAVLTALRVDGERVVVMTHLTGSAQPLAPWDARNLPIFLVATLGLALAAPARGAVRRVENVVAASLLAFGTMVATVALQLEVTAGNAARASLGLALRTRRADALLGVLNEGIGVAMLLVPATVFAVAYLRWRAAPAGDTDGRERRGVRLAAAAAVAVAVATLVVLAAIGGMPVDPRPGLVRVIELNPDAPSAHLALAYHDTLTAFSR